MEKPTLRRIRDALDASKYLDQALAVYVVLTELASDHESPTFTVAKRAIAAKSGASLRRVEEILNRFRAIGILDWRQNAIAGTKELGANTYTLTTPRTPCGTSRTPRARSRKNAKRDFCGVIEEQEKKLLEQPIERGGLKPHSHQVLNPAECL